MGVAEAGLVFSLLLISLLFLRTWKGKKAAFSIWRKRGNSARNQTNPSESFAEFIGVQKIADNMLHLADHTFVAAIRCHPVNYDLRNEVEQEGIDISFERWLTSAEWEMCWYTQARPVDFAGQLAAYRAKLTPLNEYARRYGKGMINYLQSWVDSQPRFEVVRYVLFPYRVVGGNQVELTAEQMVEKARRELQRRVRMSVVALERCGVGVIPCSTVELAEMLYYAVNRNRARAAKLDDIERHEMLSLYVTSDQDETVAHEVKKYVENQESEEQAV